MNHFCFHPFSPSHSAGKTLGLVIVIVAATILTLGTFGILFAGVHLGEYFRGKQVNQLDSSSDHGKPISFNKKEPGELTAEKNKSRPIVNTSEILPQQPKFKGENKSTIQFISDTDTEGSLDHGEKSAVTMAIEKKRKTTGLSAHYYIYKRTIARVPTSLSNEFNEFCKKYENDPLPIYLVCATYADKDTILKGYHEDLEKHFSENLINNPRVNVLIISLQLHKNKTVSCHIP